MRLSIVRLITGPVTGLIAALFVAACGSARGTTYIAAENALGPYSASVRSGDFCFVSGKIGQRGGTFELEAETSIDAVESELERNGLSLADVVLSTVYLTDIAYYGEFNAVYARRFSEPYPARACIAVRALPGEARVEIQVTARRGTE